VKTARPVLAGTSQTSRRDPARSAYEVQAVVRRTLSEDDGREAEARRGVHNHSGRAGGKGGTATTPIVFTTAADLNATAALPISVMKSRRRSSPQGIGLQRISQRVRRGRGETCDQRAATVGHHTPIMTSDALMTAQVSSPALRFRSATASFVIPDVMIIPLPISIRTWDRRGALLDFEDLTLELVARAQLLHGVLRRQRLFSIGCPATISTLTVCLMTR